MQISVCWRRLVGKLSLAETVPTPPDFNSGFIGNGSAQEPRSALSAASRAAPFVAPREPQAPSDAPLNPLPARVLSRAFRRRFKEGKTTLPIKIDTPTNGGGAGHRRPIFIPVAKAGARDGKLYGSATASAIPTVANVRYRDGRRPLSSNSASQFIQQPAGERAPAAAPPFAPSAGALGPKSRARLAPPAAIPHPPHGRAMLRASPS